MVLCNKFDRPPSWRHMAVKASNFTSAPLYPQMFVQIVRKTQRDNNLERMLPLPRSHHSRSIKEMVFAFCTVVFRLDHCFFSNGTAEHRATIYTIKYCHTKHHSQVGHPLDRHFHIPHTLKAFIIVMNIILISVSQFNIVYGPFRPFTGNKCMKKWKIPSKYY